MTTTQTDALMALADRYAFHIPGSQHSDEARAALLAALQEQAREGEVVAWHHGCNVLCADIDLWIDRCPHCGKPRPAAPAPQPAQPETLVRYCPDCGSIGPVPASARDCCPDGQRARMVPENFAKSCRETFMRAISAQPVDLPLTPEELDLCRQWFDSIQDTNAEYLEPSDYLLAEKLYRQLNMRVPNSISEITKSGIGGGR